MIRKIAEPVSKVLSGVCLTRENARKNNPWCCWYAFGRDSHSLLPNTGHNTYILTVTHTSTSFIPELNGSTFHPRHDELHNKWSGASCWFGRSLWQKLLRQSPVSCLGDASALGAPWKIPNRQRLPFIAKLPLGDWWPPGMQLVLIGH